MQHLPRKRNAFVFVRQKSLKLRWITDYLLIIDGLQIIYWLQIYRYKWLTTANGYMRLLFDTKMTVTQKQQTSSNHKLHHIGLCANVCENSFESTRVRRTNKHNISSLFIAGFSPTTYESGWSSFEICVCKRLLLLDEPNQCDPKYSFKKSCIPSKTVKDPDQQLPGDVDTKQLALKRAPIRPYFGCSSKAAPSSRLTTKFFWNSIDNHNRSCERWSML